MSIAVDPLDPVVRELQQRFALRIADLPLQVLQRALIGPDLLKREGRDEDILGLGAERTLLQRLHLDDVQRFDPLKLGKRDLLAALRLADKAHQPPGLRRKAGHAGPSELSGFGQ